MIAVGPEQRIGDQKIAHFVAPIVEYLGAPIHVFAAPGIRMLVQGAAVELRQTMIVARKMRRHPVENHADSGLMAAVDEEHEVLRRTVARGDRVVADHLVAPGRIERMLRDPHQFEVRVTHLENVGDQLFRGLPPAHERRRALVPGPAPRTQVDFVGVERPAQRIAAFALRQPLRVLPAEALQRCHHRAVIRTKLHCEPVGIGLDVETPRAVADFILIGGASADARNRQLPDS